MWHKCSIIDDFFEALEVGAILLKISLIAMVVVIIIAIAVKIKESNEYKEKKRKEQAEVESDVRFFADMIPKVPTKGLYSYWQEIDINIQDLKRSQNRSEPPYKFYATLMVCHNGRMAITMTIESGYQMFDIIERELNMRGQRSPRQ